jgi:hypothetical protein
LSNLSLGINPVLNTNAGPIVELGAWLEEQRKALRGRTLDRAKSDRFYTLVEAGKLNWRFNGFTITHSDSGTAPLLAAASAPSSSSSTAGPATASSSLSSSAATEIRGTWILAFEALVNHLKLSLIFFESYSFFQVLKLLTSVLTIWNSFPSICNMLFTVFLKRFVMGKNTEPVTSL